MPPAPQTSTDDALTTFVTELVAHVECTAPTYASNVRRDRTTHPIAFFGDVLTAQALTFGVNPSADEFRGGRLLRHTPNASETLGISASTTVWIGLYGALNLPSNAGRG